MIIILAVALIGYAGGKTYPKQFPAGKVMGNRAGAGRTVLISAICLTLWWVPVIAAGLLLGWKGIHFQEGLFFSKAALVTSAARLRCCLMFRRWLSSITAG